MTFSGRAVTYNRVSTNLKTQDTSVSTQECSFEKWFNEHPEIECAGSFKDRISCKTIDRPGLNDLQNLIDRFKTSGQNRITHFVLFHPDRYSRSVKTWSQCLDYLDALSINLVFLIGDYDTSTSEGRKNFLDCIDFDYRMWMSRRIAISLEMHEMQGDLIREKFLDVIDPSNPDDVIANAKRGYSLNNMSKIYDNGTKSKALFNKLSATLDRAGRKLEYYQIYTDYMFNIADRIGFVIDGE